MSNKSPTTRKLPPKYPCADDVERTSSTAPALKTTSKSSPVERVFVAIDVNNLWSTCQELFGKEYRVSYPALTDLICSKGTNRELFLHAYVVSTPYQKRDAKTGRMVISPPKNKRFIQYLEGIGFTVKELQLRYEKASLKPFGTDWDIGITIDALDHLDDYDTFTLLSGNGDYQILIRDLKSRGKRVEVITFRNTYSRMLHEAADEIIYMGDSEVFREKPIRRPGRESYPGTD